MAAGLHFDLVITDVRMSGVDGVDGFVLPKEKLPELRCIVMTGYADDEVPVRAIKIEVDDYLYKPFQVAETWRSGSASHQQDECRRSLPRFVTERSGQDLRSLQRLFQEGQGGLARPGPRASFSRFSMWPFARNFFWLTRPTESSVNWMPTMRITSPT